MKNKKKEKDEKGRASLKCGLTGMQIKTAEDGSIDCFVLPPSKREEFKKSQKKNQ